VVSKQLQDGSTVSSVSAVQGPERTGEIARMLGGDAGSVATVAHASEMLQRGMA
jgi:DNA repair protein RecN (Recombination protein N)